MGKAISLVVTIITSTYISPILASENNSWYIGGLYTAQDFSAQYSPNFSGLSSDSRDFKTAGIIGGYEYNDYISFETRFLKGVSESKHNFNWRGIAIDDSTSDIDYQGSILIRMSYPVTDEFNIYATSGYSKIKIDRKNIIAGVDSNFTVVGSRTYNDSFTESGFTYGLGLSYNASDKFNIFIDYQILPDWEPSYLDLEDWKPTYRYTEDWDAINIGFNYKL